MLDNTNYFIKDHKSFVNFDDLGEGSETRIGKSTIIYFNDENKNEVVNFFIN